MRTRRCASSLAVLFPTIKSAQVANNPSEGNYEHLLLILAYLKGTAEHKLKFRRDAGLRLTALVDADWGTCNSTAGWCIFLGGCTVSFGCKRERCVALSTTELS